MRLLVEATGHNSKGGYVGCYLFEVEINNPCIASAGEIIIEGNVDELINKMRVAGYVLDDITRLRRRILMASVVPQVVAEIRERAQISGLILSDYISEEELMAIINEAKSGKFN